MAQAWADKNAKDCGKMQHFAQDEKKNPEYIFKGKPTGENIHRITVQGPTDMKTIKMMGNTFGAGAADGWHAEIKYYPWPEYTGPSSNGGKEVTHFTQQVWKDTKEVGYGIGMREGCQYIYVVGRYWPAGNLMGSFAKNVMKPS